jgi:hypothetical protein
MCTGITEKSLKKWTALMRVFRLFQTFQTSAVDFGMGLPNMAFLACVPVPRDALYGVFHAYIWQ